MASPDVPFSWDGNDLVISLKVTPGSSREDFALVDNQLRAWIHAQPQDGQSNKQLVKLLSRTFKVPQSAIVILRGQTGRNKTLRISAPRTFPKFIDAR